MTVRLVTFLCTRLFRPLRVHDLFLFFRSHILTSITSFIFCYAIKYRISGSRGLERLRSRCQTFVHCHVRIPEIFPNFYTLTSTASGLPLNKFELTVLFGLRRLAFRAGITRTPRGSAYVVIVNGNISFRCNQNSVRSRRDTKALRINTPIYPFH